MHVDVGPKRESGERFAPRPTSFAVEAPPARERLAESRTMKGGGVAGVATVGAAGTEVAQDVLAETQHALLPLVPYLESLRWVFIAAALAGIAVAIYARVDDWQRGAGDRCTRRAPRPAMGKDGAPLGAVTNSHLCFPKPRRSTRRPATVGAGQAMA